MAKDDIDQASQGFPAVQAAPTAEVPRYRASFQFNRSTWLHLPGRSVNVEPYGFVDLTEAEYMSEFFQSQAEQFSVLPLPKQEGK